MKKTLIATTLIAGALLGSGTANADEQSFIDRMTSTGGYVYDYSLLLRSGWDICQQFNYRNGNEIAVDVFRNSSWEDIPNLHEAQRWVNIAADELCPWVWESGSVRAIF